MDGTESPGSKTEYSVLQQQEYDARKAPLGEAKLVELQGYTLLGLPGNKPHQNIWIMLWPKHPPFYKQVPGGNYTLTNSMLSEIKRRQLATSTVEEVLASHVEESN